jgi:hypothetical protein
MLIMMAIAAVMLLTFIGCGSTTRIAGSHAGKEAAVVGGKATWEAAKKELQEGAEVFSTKVNSKVGKNVVRKSDEETVEDASIEGLKKAAEEAVKEAGKHCLEEAEEGEDCWNVLPEHERDQTLEQVLESQHEAAKQEYIQQIFESFEEAQREEALARAIVTLEQGAASNVGTASPTASAPATASASPTTTETTQASYGARLVEGTIYTAGGSVQTSSVTVSLHWRNPYDDSVGEISPIAVDTNAQYSFMVHTGYEYQACAQSHEAAPGHYWYGCGLSSYLSPYISGPLYADAIMTLR